MGEYSEGLLGINKKPFHSQTDFKFVNFSQPLGRTYNKILQWYNYCYLVMKTLKYLYNIIAFMRMALCKISLVVIKEDYLKLICVSNKLMRDVWTKETILPHDSVSCKILHA